MNTRFSNLVRVAGSPRVVVVGDLILDSYLQGDTNRISPEAPIQVLDVREERHAMPATRLHRPDSLELAP